MKCTAYLYQAEVPFFYVVVTLCREPSWSWHHVHTQSSTIFTHPYNMWVCQLCTDNLEHPRFKRIVSCWFCNWCMRLKTLVYSIFLPEERFYQFHHLLSQLPKFYHRLQFLLLITWYYWVCNFYGSYWWKQIAWNNLLKYLLWNNSAIPGEDSGVSWGADDPPFRLKMMTSFNGKIWYACSTTSITPISSDPASAPVWYLLYVLHYFESVDPVQWNLNSLGPTPICCVKPCMRLRSYISSLKTLLYTNRDLFYLENTNHGLNFK